MQWMSIALLAIVLAQAEWKAEEKYEGKYEPPQGQVPGPRDGVWAAPPGEAGASRHAPRPGPMGGGAAEEEPPQIDLGDGEAGGAAD